MRNVKSLLIGFGVALGIGGGGGFALGPLATTEADAIGEPIAPPIVAARMVVEDVQGTAKVLTPGGAWRTAKLRDALDRPTGLRTEGIDSSITVSIAGTRMVLRHDGRLLVSASGPLALTLDSGQLLLRSAFAVRVAIPGNQGVVTGEAFGVWARKGALNVAVLDGQAMVDTPALSTKYTKGREIVVNAGGALPWVLEPQLVLEQSKIEKSGGGYQLSGRTAPNAVVLVKRGSRYEEVTVSAGGTFTAQLSGASVGAGEVVAHDAVGRRAEIGHPSESLEQILASLAGGAVVAEPVKPEPAKAEAPKPAPREGSQGETAAPPAPEEKAPPVEKAEVKKEEPKHPKEARPKEDRPAKKRPKKEESPAETASSKDEPKTLPIEIKSPPAVTPPKEELKKEEKTEEEKQDSVELQWDSN